MSLTLHSLQRSIKGFDIHKEVRDVITETSDEIAELNRGQMSLGRRADDTEITPTYSDLTIELKTEKGQETRWTTLRDTGDFWKSIKVDVLSDTFTIEATDWKTEKLMKKYGKNVMGLSKESKYEEYIPIVFMPALKKKIESKTVLRLS